MPSPVCCPICSDPEYTDLGRGLHRCRTCRTVYNCGYRPVPYEEDYFTDAYREQYGKTYREDYENIRRISSGRLAVIAGLMKKRDLKSLRLLDIGSAIGFFLTCARDAGIESVLGIEISRYASRRAMEEFRVETVNSSFGDFRGDRCFDVITGWYFVEHTENPMETLKKIYALLCDGGIMGIAVPSYFGPRYFFDREGWLADFPTDHRVEFSPGSMKRMLLSIGFRKVKIKPAGIHPERIVSKNSPLFTLFSPVYRFLSRMFAFSDTMEVYAVKKGQM